MTELSSFQAIPIATFDPAALTGTFQPLNGSGFADDIKILKIFNPSTTIGVDISYDGVTVHDYWPPGATIIIDFQTNHQDTSSYGAGTLYGRKGQIIWGKTAEAAGRLKIIGFR